MSGNANGPQQPSPAGDDRRSFEDQWRSLQATFDRENPTFRMPSGIGIGTKIDRYTVRGILGCGGFSEVFFAENNFGFPVALKVAATSGGGCLIERTLDVTNARHNTKVSTDVKPAEAYLFKPSGFSQITCDQSITNSALSSQFNIMRESKTNFFPQPIELLEYRGASVMVMQQLLGETLREKYRNRENVRLNWFLSIARHLELLHGKGLLEAHGNLKPEDIIIGSSGSVRFMDPATNIKIPSGEIRTTSPFYNPLLLKDSRADVMSIGIMLYQCLTGTLPFNGTPWKYAGSQSKSDTDKLNESHFLTYPPMKRLEEISESDWMDTKPLNSKVPDALVRIVNRCITGGSEYTLRRLIEDLESFLKR